jgi:hypothetical protein
MDFSNFIRGNQFFSKAGRTPVIRDLQQEVFALKVEVQTQRALIDALVKQVEKIDYD